MHSVSKITSWQHPRDDYFKSLVVRNRERARFVEAVLRNNSMYRFDETNCSKEVAITDDGRRATCLPSLLYPSCRLRDPFFTAVRCVQLRVEARRYIYIYNISSRLNSGKGAKQRRRAASPVQHFRARPTRA